MWRGYVSPGLNIFSLTDKCFISQEPEGNYFPEPRKNNIAELIASQMLISGVIIENNKILNSLYFLNFESIKMEHAPNEQSDPCPKLYDHSGCAVLPKS